MLATQQISEIIGQRDVLDSKLDNGQILIKGELHFSQHFGGFVRIARQNQNHYFALSNGPRDFARATTRQWYVPRCEPAADISPFERLANGISFFLVFGGMTDKNVACHWKELVSLLHFGSMRGNPIVPQDES
jgi:hypothetical protein